MTARAIASDDRPIDALGAGGSGAEEDHTALVTPEEGDLVLPADELAVGGAVAIVGGTDSALALVAVGALGHGAEEEVLRSGSAGHTERERAGGVAVDAVGAAVGLPGDRHFGDWARVRGCQAEYGGEGEEERCVLHCVGDVAVRGEG